jgi:hypothetical protein
MNCEKIVTGPDHSHFSPGLQFLICSEPAAFRNEKKDFTILRRWVFGPLCGPEYFHSRIMAIYPHAPSGNAGIGWGHISDTAHIFWGVATEILFLAALAFATRAFDKQFFRYYASTFMILLVFGVLIFKDAPGIAANLPTPYIGIRERINIRVFLLWVIVLAFTILKIDKAAGNNYRAEKIP